MSPTQTIPVEKSHVTRKAVPSQAGNQSVPQPSTGSTITEPDQSPSISAKRAGYGLPCAGCKTYYAANLASCPVCHATDRVSAIAAIKANTAISNEKFPDPEVLEEERERFLREFTSQAYAASLQLGPAATTHCTRLENHQETPETAAICQGCYDQLQERVDVLEAVLHMDVKEAAEVI
jgi:hypothetical protein